MNKMKDRLEKLRRQRYGCGVLLISNMAITAVLAVLLLVNWFLPLWVGRSLLPELAAAGGIKGVSAQVRRLGLTGTDLEHVRLDLDGRRVLEVDSLRVDYSLPWWPFQRHLRISGVTVSGARIHASWQNGVFTIPGFFPAVPVKRPAAASKTPSEKKTSGGPSPLHLESITLNRCVLKLDTGKGVFDLPFSATLRCPDGDINRINAEWEIYGGEDLVSGRAKWDGGTGALALTLDGSFHPARFRTLIPGADALQLGGMAKFAVRLDGRLGGPGGPQLTGTLSFPQLGLFVAGWTLINGSTAAPAKLRFKLDGTRGEYELTDLGVAGMISPVVEKIKGTFAVPLGRVDVDGVAAVRLPAGPTAFPTVAISQDIRLVKEYHLTWSAVEQSGSWRVKGGTADKTAVVADIGPGQLRIPRLNWRSRGDLGRHGGTAYDFNLQAEMTALPALTWAMKGMEVAVRPLTFRCEARRQGGEYSGGLKLTAEELTIPAMKLKTGKATLELPLLLMRQNAWQGGLRLDKINWSGNNLADLEMTVTQVDDGLDFSGLVRQQLLPGSVWPCRCRVNLKPYPGGTFELRIEPYRLPEAMSLGAYFPAGEGVTLGGQVAAKLEYRFGAAGNGGTAELQLRDGSLTSKKIDLEVTGIDADLTLAALPSLRTPPLQSLRCRSWRVGKLLGSELLAEFQVAKNGTLLLENFSTDWCGGKVYTSSLRVAPGQRNWHANLYCEGIVLSQLLNDLGIARAVGKGTIHGRIPLRFGADGIHLEPGFLYSVPGVTNTLRLSDMEKLIDNLPKGSPAHAQLDLAMEALKDYDYDWARLNFATSGENLRVEMKFDGHPNRPLPFEYKNVNGQDILIRVEGRGANFQGIRLDVNNSVPLNQLLRINQSIKNITGGKRP